MVKYVYIHVCYLGGNGEICVIQCINIAKLSVMHVILMCCMQVHFDVFMQLNVKVFFYRCMSIARSHVSMMTLLLKKTHPLTVTFGLVLQKFICMYRLPARLVR